MGSQVLSPSLAILSWVLSSSVCPWCLFLFLSCAIQPTQPCNCRPSCVVASLPASCTYSLLPTVPPSSWPAALLTLLCLARPPDPPLPVPALLTLPCRCPWQVPCSHLTTEPSELHGLTHLMPADRQASLPRVCSCRFPCRPGPSLTCFFRINLTSSQKLSVTRSISSCWQGDAFGGVGSTLGKR